MILAQCPACAAPLPDLTAKQCSRCKTRYCGAACQKQDWEAGGHDKLCRKIRKGGGAEQYHAKGKYREAVAVAAEACAEDTKGQTCFICTQALHWKTKEGLVRGCSCRGTAGFVHLSCLAKQAKISVAEAEENNWDDDRFMPRWRRWRTCSLCEQMYHGDVKYALGWACWMAYVGRPEGDAARRYAMTELGNGLSEANRLTEALCVKEAELSILRRLGAQEKAILATQGNLAMMYHRLGRSEEALLSMRDVYLGFLKLEGKEGERTLVAANNYANFLVRLQRFFEARSLMCGLMPVARRSLGQVHELTLTMKKIYAEALYKDSGATLDDLREAVTILEDLERTGRRVLGGSHPRVRFIEASLESSRAALGAREGDECTRVDLSSLRNAVAAMTPPGGA